jgi:membrane protease YdiL (CAAX protease family)
VLKYFGAFIVWNLAMSVALLALPPAVGLPVILLLTAAFLWGSLLRSRRPLRHYATLRLRPLRGRVLHWTLASVPVFLAFNWALGEMYVRLVPVPPENFDPFAALMVSPAGRLAVTVLAVAIAPLLEELVFRGVVQHTLERRWGDRSAIGATALLFALVHFRPWVLPLYIFLGLAFGYAVYATRSIWAGVVLHAANNATAMLGVGTQTESPSTPPTLWVAGPTRDWWLSLLAVVAFGALLFLVARGLWNARPGHRLRHAVADG